MRSQSLPSFSSICPAVAVQAKDLLLRLYMAVNSSILPINSLTLLKLPRRMALSASTTTAPDGSFAFEGLDSGEYEVFVSGALPTDLSFLARVVLERGQTEHVEWVAGAESIEGRVTSQVGGEPVSSAVVVLRDGEPSEELAQALQDHVKATTAPYKYPRIVVYRDDLPKTGTGKIDRQKLQSEG